MVFQSSRGLEQNRKVQIALGTILAAFAIGFYFHTKFAAPRVGIVDGIYRNECCSDIVIEGDNISYKKVTLYLRISEMKFGLTGYVNGQFGFKGLRVSKDTTVITFFDAHGRRALSLPIDGHEYLFKRADSSNAI